MNFVHRHEKLALVQRKRMAEVEWPCAVAVAQLVCVVSAFAHRIARQNDSSREKKNRKTNEKKKFHRIAKCVPIVCNYKINIVIIIIIIRERRGGAGQNTENRTPTRTCEWFFRLFVCRFLVFISISHFRSVRWRDSDLYRRFSHQVLQVCVVRRGLSALLLILNSTCIRKRRIKLKQKKKCAARCVCVCGFNVHRSEAHTRGRRASRVAHIH